MDKQAADLIAAYHVIFDAKDNLPPGEWAYYKAYEALSSLGYLLIALGVDVPVRFDAPRPEKAT